jgi:hypothetical protein
MRFEHKILNIKNIKYVASQLLVISSLIFLKDSFACVNEGKIPIKIDDKNKIALITLLKNTNPVVYIDLKDVVYQKTLKNIICRGGFKLTFSIDNQNLKKHVLNYKVANQGDNTSTYLIIEDSTTLYNFFIEIDGIKHKVSLGSDLDLLGDETVNYSYKADGHGCDGYIEKPMILIRKRTGKKDITKNSNDNLMSHCDHFSSRY